jgi:hypothetical protein
MNPNDEAARHHRMAADFYEQSASCHRLAAEAWGIGYQDDAERLAIEASRLHREGLRHEEEANRHRE